MGLTQSAHTRNAGNTGNTGNAESFVSRPPLSGQDGNAALAWAERLDGYRDKIQCNEPNGYVRRKDHYTASLWAIERTVYPSKEWESGQIVWMDPTADGGLPHTRPPNIICLPINISDNSLKSTVEHEQIHIHQRQNTEFWIQNLESMWQFRPWSGSLPSELETRRRLNPDLLPFPLFVWRNEWVPVMLFRSLRPESLQDAELTWFRVPSRTVHRDPPPGWKEFFGDGLWNEHPMEIAAYLFSQTDKNPPAKKALEPAIARLKASITSK